MTSSADGHSVHDTRDTYVDEEQEYLDMLLKHLSQRRDELNSRAADVRRINDPENPQTNLQRDVEYHMLQQRLSELTHAENGLLFGRLDIQDEHPEHAVAHQPGIDRRYIGKIGLSDAELTTLLMDWRAPQARPFYMATTLNPEGVRIRRHIKTSGSHVTGVYDENLSELDSQNVSTSAQSIAQETGLIDALNRRRTKHMGDIVDTIATEQDEIIRDDSRGTIVVEGGPGTGKTAVALHRAAYLLYTWREQLSAEGVLILGPNAQFLDYVSHLLPSLGETGVVLGTTGTLFPGIEPTGATESLMTQEVKGSLDMLDILGRAVQYYQQGVDEPTRVRVDGIDIEITPAMTEHALSTARNSGLAHNKAQRLFTEDLKESVRDAMVHTFALDPLDGQNLLDEADMEDLLTDIGQDEQLADFMEDLWPLLSPTELLSTLLSDPDLIDYAAEDYDQDTRNALYRPVGDQWSDTDAPLLDELAEIIGINSVDEDSEQQQRELREKLEEAQEALDILEGSSSQDLDDDFEAEILMAYDLIDAEQLALRQLFRQFRSVAQRARADRQWQYGHIIVDEAQEVSAMAWRMIFRRSANKWITLVGDPAQTGSPAGVESWDHTLSPFVADRWGFHHLSVNYRTPADISEIADKILNRIREASETADTPDERHEVSLRPSGTGVHHVRSAPDELAKNIDATLKNLENSGLRGVIFSLADLETFRHEYPRLFSSDDTSDDLFVGSVQDAKGLEFDEVILVEPEHIVQQSPHGLQDLYVALTRATQGLTVIHSNDHLPWDSDQ